MKNTLFIKHERERDKERDRKRKWLHSPEGLAWKKRKEEEERAAEIRAMAEYYERKGRYAQGMSHAAYLKSKRWSYVKEGVIGKRGLKCEICGSHDQIEVHHNTYVRRANELDEDLLVVCRNCHATFHENHTLSNWRGPKHWSAGCVTCNRKPGRTTTSHARKIKFCGRCYNTFKEKIANREK